MHKSATKEPNGPNEMTNMSYACTYDTQKIELTYSCLKIVAISNLFQGYGILGVGCKENDLCITVLQITRRLDKIGILQIHLGRV